ncbi:carbonic anhydrase [Leptolyngbya sp. FACHB-17]|uniref:carbonic anhydrase n=1 Tax=unclassified Leptolyngbya TaxID=2650499 RepID=UPI00168070F8|nr:carbonic anhydrase [Leptolyngbya sp. FACHB-17]MBD2081837.1 carbonic anhydrase [Leptolyngbya sp. FACHB-17]
MKKLIQGHRQFRESYVPKHLDQLEELSHGQKPRVLFITCSDSRIDPNLITHADIGDLFVIRNAGNIIPPYGAANGGEGAAVEYAINALDIQQIIVCGHSHCGAMKGLLQLGKLEEEMPLVYEWLKHSEATRRLVRENYSQYSGEQLLEITIAENVLTQIENLKTYPVVHSRLYQRKLEIFAWVYHIETGEVLAFDPDTHAYVPPQSQLSIRERGEVVPKQYAKTSAPPVACELVPDAPVPSNGNGKSPEPVRQPVRAEVPVESMPWLTPEQADRIYRGSVARRQ